MRIGDWTLKEVVQGKPWAHPTHAMFVHFPTALYPTALLVAAISHVRPTPYATDVATFLIGLGVLATIPAAVTGLLDWSGMTPRSTKRNVATRHMLLQVAALSLAVVAFVLFIVAGDGPARFLGSVAIGASVLVLVVGNWLGGTLVYRMAMRVGGTRAPAKRAG